MKTQQQIYEDNSDKKSAFFLKAQVETFSRNICGTALQNKFQQALHRGKLMVETCSGTLKLVSKFVVPVSD